MVFEERGIYRASLGPGLPEVVSGKKAQKGSLRLKGYRRRGEHPLLAAAARCPRGERCGLALGRWASSWEGRGPAETVNFER